MNEKMTVEYCVCFDECEIGESQLTKFDNLEQAQEYMDKFNKWASKTCGRVHVEIKIVINKIVIQ